MRRRTVQLLMYLGAIVMASYLAGLLLAPVLPFPFAKILRRAATIIAALTFIPFVTRIQHRRWTDMGLAQPAHMRHQFLTGLAVGAALFTALLFILQQAGVARFFAPTTTAWLALAAFVPAALLIGVLEEVFFRGVVLQSLLADMPTAVAVTLSSAFYAILHFAKYLAQPLQILPELFGLWLLGCVLATAYLRTKSLALPIGVHMSVAYLAKVDRHFVEFIGREPRWIFGNDKWLTGVIGWGLLLAAWGAIVLLTRRAASPLVTP